VRDEFPRACPESDESETLTAPPAKPLSEAAEELLWIAERAGLDVAAREALRTEMADWSRRFARRALDGESQPETEEAGLVALTVDHLRRFLRA
jgi:hypothetical protein